MSVEDHFNTWDYGDGIDQPMPRFTILRDAHDPFSGHDVYECTTCWSLTVSPYGHARFHDGD